MNVMDLLAQARPASLDPQPDPARRERDLAAAFAEGQPGQHDPARPARRIVIAGGVAVIAGGVAAAVAVASSGEPGFVPTPSPVQRAVLTAISGVAGDVLHTGLTGTADGGVVTDTWRYPLSPQVGQQVHVRANVVGGDDVVRTAIEWVYRQQPESPDTATASAIQMTEVQYGNRTWSRRVINAAFVNDPTFDLTGMRELVAQGVWRVAGRTKINGRKVIRLTRHWSAAGTTGTRTLWVDARTYLPVRLVERDSGGSQQADFGYLPPSAANLAKLTLTIPPGFNRAPHP